MDPVEESRQQTKPAAVITGATQGIGRALAEEFAKNGHTLLLVARNEANLAAAAQAIASAHGVAVHYAACDLATGAGCDRVEEVLNEKGLHCESLVNNAAVMTAGYFQDQDRDALLRTIDLNLRATVDLSRRFLPGMIARGAGGVLNVSSVEGFMPVPFQATYAATKAAMISLSRSLAFEVMGTGVRVCTVAPGPVVTDIHAKAGSEYSRYVLYYPQMQPDVLAEAAYRRFMRGNWVILEGWLNKIVAIGVRFVPGFFLIPASGWFFRVRDAEGNPQWPKPIDRSQSSTDTNKSSKR